MGMRIAGDEGKAAECFDDPTCAPYLETLAKNLARNLVARREAEPPMPSLPVL